MAEKLMLDCNNANSGTTGLVLRQKEYTLDKNWFLTEKGEVLWRQSASSLTLPRNCIDWDGQREKRRKKDISVLGLW